MDTPNASNGLLLLASAAKTVTEKKRRCRDPLAPSARELRYSEVSQVQDFYFNQQRSPKTPAFEANVSRKNTMSSIAAVNARRPIEQPIQNLSFSSPDVVERISHEQRRLAIYSVFYSCYGGVDKEFWASNGVIVGIMNRLGIPRGSRQSVENVLDDILLARSEDRTYDPSSKLKNCGRQRAIIEGSSEETLLLRCQEHEMSITQTTCLINEIRASAIPPFEALSWSAVASFVRNSPLIHKSKREFQKCGSRDPESLWAKARVGLCSQFYKQLMLGVQQDPIAGQYEHDISLLELDGEEMTVPLQLHAIAWWDEHHKKCILGPVCKRETRIWQDDAGAPTKQEDGGVLPNKKRKTSAKFVQEARGCFGVAMRRNDEGYEGVRAAPFNYSGRTVVGVKNFVSRCNEEMRRVKQLKGRWGQSGEGYPERYPLPLDYMVFVRAEVSKSFCCITDIMDHVVAESTKIYANTPVANTFMLFHVGLSTWWEKEAQEYLATLGFRDRQLTSLGATNRGSAYYEGKLVGNSPELCRGLDAHGFSDLETSIHYHVSLTRMMYDEGDPRKFLTGTPKEMWSTMERCWQVEPTSERIVEDVLAFPRVLRVIINAKGCVVADDQLRSGRRYVAVDERSELKHKPRDSQRKSTIRKSARVCHPDAEGAKILLVTTITTTI
jgi:hypothetical protein